MSTRKVDMPDYRRRLSDDTVHALQHAVYYDAAGAHPVVELKSKQPSQAHRSPQPALTILFWVHAKVQGMCTVQVHTSWQDWCMVSDQAFSSKKRQDSVYIMCQK